MIVTGFLLLGTYIVLLSFLLKGYSKISCFRESACEPSVGFSIIVPFRNEAQNLSNLLISLSALNYPTNLYEVIFIDDASTDDSVTIIKKHKPNFNFKILKNRTYSKAPKKDAITLGVDHAQYNWIITTDADCKVPRNWLLIYNSFILKNNPYFIAGGVRLENSYSFLSSYQVLDNCSLQTTTVGSFGLNNPFLCNGANLGFLKPVFKQVNGYVGNNHLASGDDIFLLEKIKHINPSKVHYVKSKDCIVTTTPVNSWKALLNQRVRWASKINAQNNKGVIPLGILIASTNVYFIVGLIYSVLQTNFLFFYLGFVLLKGIMDSIFIYKSCLFLNQSISFRNFFKTIFIYPIITIIVLLKSFSKKYTWKDRSY